MNQPPLITIGITCYNAEDSIESAVKSAINQSWPNKEIVIVDDQSNDRSRDIIQKIQQQQGPEISVHLHNKNQGVAAARNTIIKNTKGEFIVFFDDDDTSDETRLEKQYQRIISTEKSNPEYKYVICHTARQQNYPDNTSRYEPTMAGAQNTIINGNEFATRLLIGRPAPHIFGSAPTCSQMARTKTYIDLKGFDENFRRSEDTELNVRIARAGGVFVGLEEPLVTQKMTLTNDKSLNEEEACTLKLLKKHQDFYPTVHQYKFCKAWTQAKYHFLNGQKLIFIQKLIFLAFKNPALCIQRIIWAIPNTKFNLKFTRYYND